MNRLARYVGGGVVEIVSEPAPACPPGGLLVRTEACGLCSGELMAWYMDRKLPHVLGHEVAGVVEESQDERFPVGCRVFPHHHAPCLRCEMCTTGREVHCPQWKSTRLSPGGMATYFAVASENLTDTVRLDDLDAKDAALTEPLACVAKSIRGLASESVGVIGLGFMGLLHMLVLPRAVGYDLNPQRCEHSRKLGLAVGDVASVQPADVVYVLPGNQGAFDLALEAVRPQGTIVMFAPLPPGQFLQMPQTAYFKDVTIRNAYSAGPSDTAQAVRWLRSGVIKAEAVVSDFISLDQLPNAYVAMRDGKILKPMVLFS